MKKTTPLIIGESLGPSSKVDSIVAMQLSSITYCSNIPATLQANLPEWKAVWIPEKAIKGQFAFIAYNGSQYAVAIRGSILTFSWGAFDNWFTQDFNIFKQVPWLYPGNTSTKPMISQGTANALENLISLKDKNGDTILSFLMDKAIGNNKSFCVTGHSLGAYLSTAFATWLLFQIKQAKKPAPPIFSVFTFAAPTTDNKAFADQFDASFPNSWRYHNLLDFVPHSASNVAGMALLFPPPGIISNDVKVIYRSVTVSLAEAIYSISILLYGSQYSYGSYYSHTNIHRGSVPLNLGQTIFPVKSKEPIEAWFEQVAQQHAHNHYLKFLGAPPLTCVT